MWEVILGIVLTYMFAIFCPNKFQGTVEYIQSYFEPRCKHDEKKDKRSWRN